MWFFHIGILQKGDGTNMYLKNKPRVLITAMGDGHQRPMHCHQCDGNAKRQRLLAPVALASAPDGSLYVGDFNLIRRISLDGHVATVVELRWVSVFILIMKEMKMIFIFNVTQLYYKVII